MKIWAWAAAVGSVAAFVACGGSETGNTGGAGGNAASSSSSTTVSVSSSSGNPSTSSSGTGGTTGCGSFLYSTDTTCQSCAETNCCAELQACDTGTACNDLFTCLDGCNDQACQDMCIQQNQGGLSDAQGLITCMTGPQGGTGACNMECSTGQICDTGLTINGNPACGDCLGASCCADYQACVADQTCLDCITGMTTAGCDTNPLVAATRTCRDMNCGDACGKEICDTGLSTSNGKCDTCLGNKCCQQIKDCQADTNCFNNCLTNPNPPASCGTDMKYQAVKTCWNTGCAGPNDCNGML